MRSATRLTLLVVSLIAGIGLLCAADPVRKDQATPKPGPRPPTRDLFQGRDQARHDGPPAASGRWEYRVVSHQQLLDLGKKDVTAGLNRLGEEGWELTAVVPPGAPGRRGGGDEVAEYYFKRPAGRSAAAAEPPAPPGEGEFRAFRLKNASAGMTARVIDELMNGEGGGPRRARVVVEPATNQLLVRGRPMDLEFIEAVLSRIDVPEATGLAESGEGAVKVFRLKNASAPEVAKVLDELMNGNENPRRVRISSEPITNQLLVRARGEDLATIAKLLVEIDVPADNQPPRKK